LLSTQLEKGIQVGDALQAVRRLVPPTPAAAGLRGMVQHRHGLIAENTRRKNKLTAICDELFPELTRLLRNPNLPTALALRSRFPTPADLATASFEELREARGRTCSVSDAKLVALQRLAKESIGTKDPARLRSLVVEQQQLIEELALIGQHIAQLETEMVKIVESCREGKILLSIPGIGPLAAATLIALIGTIANFERAAQRKLVCRVGSQSSAIGINAGLDTTVSSRSAADEADDVSHRVESDPVGFRVETDV
jgi:transposase